MNDLDLKNGDKTFAAVDI